jgi:hypothetical protein
MLDTGVCFQTGSSKRNPLAEMIYKYDIYCARKYRLLAGKRANATLSNKPSRQEMQKKRGRGISIPHIFRYELEFWTGRSGPKIMAGLNKNDNVAL